MPRANRYKIKSATFETITVEDLKQDRANPDFQKRYRTKEITIGRYSVSRKFLGNFKRPRTTRATFFTKPKLATKILNIRRR